MDRKIAWQNMLNHSTLILVAVFVFFLEGCNPSNDENPPASVNKKLKLNENINIVWVGDDGWDQEIFLLHRNQIKRLTNNDYDDGAADIHDNVVVWASKEDTTSDSITIFRYDMVSVKKLAKLSKISGGPVTSHGKVAWSGYNGSNYEIYLWRNDSIINISNRIQDDFWPVISGDTIAWVAYNGSNDMVYMWDGHSVRGKSGTAGISGPYELSGGKIVWESGHQVVVWDGYRIDTVANSEFTQWHPDIDQNIIVWDSDNKIWMLRNDSTIQISNSEYGDEGPKVHNGMVTWMRVLNAGFRQIMFWDGSREHQLTFEKWHHYNPVVWVDE